MGCCFNGRITYEVACLKCNASGESCSLCHGESVIEKKIYCTCIKGMRTEVEECFDVAKEEESWEEYLTYLQDDPRYIAGLRKSESEFYRFVLQHGERKRISCEI